jgi:hypothetical protein
MKNAIVVLTTVFALAFSAVSSLAANTTVEGTISGYTCVVLGKACPVDREDPVIAMEKVFVVVKADGSYYLVPNVDRAILARHLTEKVRVTGAVDEKYNSVDANKLEVYVMSSRHAATQDPTRVSPLVSKDGWKTVWSQSMEDEARAWLSAPTP